MLTPDEIRALREYTEIDPGTVAQLLEYVSRRDRLGKRLPRA